MAEKWKYYIGKDEKAANGVTFKEFIDSYEAETSTDLHTTKTDRDVAEILWDRYCDAQYHIKEGRGF